MCKKKAAPLTQKNSFLQYTIYVLGSNTICISQERFPNLFQTHQDLRKWIFLCILSYGKPFTFTTEIIKRPARVDL